MGFLLLTFKQQVGPDGQLFARQRQRGTYSFSLGKGSVLGPFILTSVVNYLETADHFLDFGRPIEQFHFTFLSRGREKNKKFEKNGAGSRIERIQLSSTCQLFPVHFHGVQDDGILVWTVRSVVLENCLTVCHQSTCICSLCPGCHDMEPTGRR